MKVKSSVNRNGIYQWMSLSLKVGVFLAFILITIGLIMLYITENLRTDLLVPLNELVGKLNDVDAALLISLGVIVLLFTPIIQIIIAVVRFAFDRDKLYLGICIVLLCILSISFLVSVI
jgi:uncharacterized membrane protein